jgi:hypothetical protein
MSNVTATQAGGYRVVVSNDTASVTSALAVLSVVVPPSITIEPMDQVMTAGSAATFSVTATGSPAPGYQWRKDGVDLAGAVQPTWTVGSVQPSSAGAYSVVVANAGGSVTSSPAMLTVRVAPSIVTQPANLTLAQGASGLFSVTATGSGPLRYQWFFNGTALAGQTADSLVIAGAASGQAGSYKVVVSNDVAIATSSSATLTVTQPLPSDPQPVAAAMVNGYFRLRLTGPINRTYVIWASTNLATWKRINTVNVTKVPIEFIDTSSVGVPTRLYKVTLGP